MRSIHILFYLFVSIFQNFHKSPNFPALYQFLAQGIWHKTDVVNLQE